jgi:hypothetical protein
MLGAIIVLAVIFVLGPIGLFLVGAAWSALTSYLLSEDADERAGQSAEPA